MNLGGLLQNHVLLTGMAGWILAQALKIPIDYLPIPPLELGLVLCSRRHAQFSFRTGYLHSHGGRIALWL